MFHVKHITRKENQYRISVNMLLRNAYTIKFYIEYLIEFALMIKFYKENVNYDVEIMKECGFHHYLHL